MALPLFYRRVSLDRPVLIGVRASRFRDELAGWIRGQGFPTFVTSVGREAVDWLRRTPESVSFLDRDLDRVDGEEVWRTVVSAGRPADPDARPDRRGSAQAGTPVGDTSGRWAPASPAILCGVAAVKVAAVDGVGDADGPRPVAPSRRAGRLVLLAERPTKELWLTALGDGVATVLPLPAGQDAVLLALRLAARS